MATNRLTNKTMLTTNETRKVSQKVIYPELSYEIVGMLFETHSELGPYAKEKKYGDLIEQKLKERDFKYNRELAIGNTGNIADFLIEDKIILELKAVRKVDNECYRQIQNYLQQTGMKLGILVNFRTSRIRPVRVVKIDNAKQH